MTAYPHNNPIIDALYSYPANSIYTLTSKGALYDGYNDYHRQSVNNIKWNNNRTTLLVFFSLDLNHVKISLENSRPVFTCRCGANSDAYKCEHIVCAIMTIAHLLKPNLFKLTNENPGLRKSLLASLMDTSAAAKTTKTPKAKSPDVSGVSNVLKITDTLRPEQYGIIIENLNNHFSFYVARGSEKINYGFIDKHTPTNLVHLIRARQSWLDSQEQFIAYLEKHANMHPILFNDGDVITPVMWKKTLKYDTWTELDAHEKEIFIHKQCSVEDINDKIVVLGDFVFDLTHKRFCYAQNITGWEFWNRLRYACRQNPEIAFKVKDKKDLPHLSISTDNLTKLQFSISVDEKERMLKSTSFNIDGQKTTVESLTVTSYTLTAMRETNGGKDFIITPECRIDDYPVSPSKGISILARALGSGNTPAAIKTKKRKALIFNAFFQAASQSTHAAREGTIKNILDEDAISKPQLRRLARSLVRKQISHLEKDELQLHFYNGKWGLIPVDKKKTLAIYTTLFEIFGHTVFDRAALTDSGLAVDETELYKNLYTLYARLAENNIEMLFDNQPLLSATWEFELDTTKSSIDWFEIRPEIKCNGKIIDSKLWEQALANKGMVHFDGRIQILDTESLKTLSALFQATGSSKAGQREIVVIQRLRILDLVRLRKEKVTVKLPPEDEKIIARLLQFEKIEERSLPEKLIAKLRHYQKEGYYWLSFLYENRFGACLADDMGLGKTVQAITLLAGIKEGKIFRPAKAKPLFLIVVPPSLLFNWEREIEKFYPDLVIYGYQGKERSQDFDGYDVILTTYGLVRRDIDKLKDVSFDVIVFDEAQAIKNIFADTTGAVRQLKAYFKLALTGTPVENHIGEYFSILDLCLPGLLGKYDDFMRQAKQEISSLIPVVVARTKPFVLRRTKEQILKELPPKIEYDIYLDLTEKQKALYNNMVNEVRFTIQEAYKSKTASRAKIIALTAILKLRQICLSPQLLIKDLDDPSPKIDFLKDKLEELRAESHGALVFSQFTSFLDIVEKEIGGNGFRIFRLDGSTPVIKRKEIVEGFQECSDPAIFLLSLKAGGQGLNLTRAAYVFHLDPWWNPAVENQASDRTHRIGQKNKVIVTRILMRHSVEEKMMELKKRKTGLYKAIMESPEKSSRFSITKDDFDFLLSS